MSVEYSDNGREFLAKFTVETYHMVANTIRCLTYISVEQVFIKGMTLQHLEWNPYST